ncbi:hypothetical protein DAI22_10g129400 [Oryza sativa Japonica Group]|nr:hypothetical protein DAI22_10g129400 [Oryza sativa Japonica Group]
MHLYRADAVLDQRKCWICPSWGAGCFCLYFLLFWQPDCVCDQPSLCLHFCCSVLVAYTFLMIENGRALPLCSGVESEKKNPTIELRKI